LHSRGGRICLHLWSKGMVFDLPFTPLELGEAAFRVFWNGVGEESADRAQLLCFLWRSNPALGVSYLSLRTAWFRFFDKTWQKGSYKSFWMFKYPESTRIFSFFSRTVLSQPVLTFEIISWLCTICSFKSRPYLT
jgi:hypothetical protein